MVSLAGRNTPIGIDAAGMRVTAAQLCRRGGGWTLSAVARYTRKRPGAPLDAEEIQRLRDVLRRQAFVGRDVVLAVPGSALLAALLQAPPPTSAAPISAIVRNELSQAYDVVPNAIEASYWYLPQSDGPGQDCRVMAVGCTHEKAEAMLDLFEEAGLRVKGLDSKAWAIARGLSGNEAPGGMVATLDVEWESTVLACLCDGEVRYERTVSDMGLKDIFKILTDVDDVDEEVCQYVLGNLDISEGAYGEPGSTGDVSVFRPRLVSQIEKLTADLQESLAYVVRQFPAEPICRLSLVGGAATIPGLASHLNEKLQFDVPVLGVASAAVDDGDTVDADLVPAVGLALYGEVMAA